MIEAKNLHTIITTLLAEIAQGVKDAPCGVGTVRVSQITINGDVAFDGVTSIAETTTVNQPLDDTVTRVTEAQTTQSQESTDNTTQEVARGGEKIFERTSTTTEE